MGKDIFTKSGTRAATGSIKGETAVVINLEAVNRLDGSRNSKKARIKLGDTLAHEAAHAAQRVFGKQSSANQAVVKAAEQAFDKKSSSYDKALDVFMRGEYPRWKKLTPSQKVAEATRAIVEGRYKAEVG